MNHTWELQKREAGQKVYICSKCGTGPVRIPEMTQKGNITKTAKKQGIDPNCMVELVNKVHEL